MSLAAALTLAGASHGSIPPRYGVEVMSTQTETRAVADALVQYMSAMGAFSRHELDIAWPPVTACLNEADFAGCARALMPGRAHWSDPAPILVRAQAAGPGQISVVCVGSGEHRAPSGGSEADIDVQVALFGGGEDRDSQLRAMLACLRSAALESSAP
ncbi:MAG: hypothetical protein LAT81_08760 [Oceanicaulis sp.]|nr:hypothetical protein [Oceanicaulis sp.]